MVSQVADKLCDLHQNDNKHFDKTPLFFSTKKATEISCQRTGKKLTVNGCKKTCSVGFVGPSVRLVYLIVCTRMAKQRKKHIMKMAQFYSTVKMIIFFNSHKEIQCMRYMHDGYDGTKKCLCWHIQPA